MTMDFNQAANAMFPNMANDPAPRSTQQPTTDLNETAERLFGPAQHDRRIPAKGDETQYDKASEGEKADRMFSGQRPELNHGNAMRDIEGAALENLLDHAEAADEAAFWGETFSKFDLSSTESAMLTNVGISTLNNPATPEIVMSWVEESRAVLVQDFGPQGARQALDDARQFVNAYGTPELIDILNATGLGNHPAVIRVITAKARAAKLAGKL